MNPSQNKPQRVVITGGASGIGLATAQAFLDEGARVGIISRSPQSLDKALHGPLSQYQDGRCHGIVADVADEAAMANAFKEFDTLLQGIDTVVASAGIEGEMGNAVQDVTSKDFLRVLEVNVLGVFHAVKHALPFLAEQQHASITIIGSDSGFVAVPGMLAYNASKGALVQLTRALSFELFEAHGIRVNSVCPSIVDTPMARRGLGVESFDDAEFPVNTPSDIAGTVLFLSGEGSRAINGANILSDFGYSARSSFPA
ncbi:SDR family NAD(P)-dependent oxidoreductase [Arthrobacter sp. M4]|uniref:SDR family NAD(P)-dependent oxidoreductase n=1 Tax=Arthrobacter sp. M4 TaxID=218160 RepID=UPI001CDB7A89|nr:SDR family oxidoreductase [Arthrobacter sp. M4]MCA4132553.1 SDR family oxidoreductase [Arthrobacter sp. M4]